MDDLSHLDSTEGDPLTPKEDDVMERTVQGQTNAQITYGLHIGNSTLMKHLAHIYAKLAPGRGKSGASYELGRRDQKRDDEAEG